MPTKMNLVTDVKAKGVAVKVGLQVETDRPDTTKDAGTKSVAPAPGSKELPSTKPMNLFG